MALKVQCSWIFCLNLWIRHWTCGLLSYSWWVWRVWKMNTKYNDAHWWPKVRCGDPLHGHAGGPLLGSGPRGDQSHGLQWCYHIWNICWTRDLVQGQPLQASPGSRMGPRKMDAQMTVVLRQAKGTSRYIPACVRVNMRHVYSELHSLGINGIQSNTVWINRIVKIRNKWRPTLKTTPTQDKISLVIQTMFNLACFTRLTWPESVLLIPLEIISKTQTVAQGWSIPYHLRKF